MVERLFEQGGERGVFKDLNVLGPHYIPEELPHRASEAKSVSRILTPVLRNEKPNNIFVYGTTGTGKTSVVRHVIRELDRAVGDLQGNVNKALVREIYMNCRTGYGSKYQILVKILTDDSLNHADLKSRPLDDRKNRDLVGISPTRLYEKMKSVVESNNISLIVILDEIDTVKDVDELMYMLTRINDEIKGGRVSLIGISNNSSFKEMLDARSKSTLCEEELVFKPYNAQELEAILKQRAEIGLNENAISDGALKLIAAYAARTNGDARYALKLLQKAGELAECDSRKAVKIEDVKSAKMKVEEDIVSESVRSLPENQQVVLYSIADSLVKGGQYKRLGEGVESDVVFSGEVYEHYLRICKNIHRTPITMRWFRDYLNELDMMGLIMLELSGKGVRGKTTIIRLGRNPGEIKDIVEVALGLK